MSLAVTKIPTAAQDAKKYRAALQKLTLAVMTHVNALDKEMKRPSDNERGRRIAGLCNILEMANDHARYFGLGVDWRTDRKGC